MVTAAAQHEVLVGEIAGERRAPGHDGVAVEIEDVVLDECARPGGGFHSVAVAVVGLLVVVDEAVVNPHVVEVLVAAVGVFDIDGRVAPSRQLHAVELDADLRVDDDACCQRVGHLDVHAVDAKATQLDIVAVEQEQELGRPNGGEYLGPEIVRIARDGVRLWQTDAADEGRGATRRRRFAGDGDAGRDADGVVGVRRDVELEVRLQEHRLPRRLGGLFEELPLLDGVGSDVDLYLRQENRDGDAGDALSVRREHVLVVRDRVHDDAAGEPRERDAVERQVGCDVAVGRQRSGPRQGHGAGLSDWGRRRRPERAGH